MVTVKRIIFMSYPACLEDKRPQTQDRIGPENWDRMQALSRWIKEKGYPGNMVTLALDPPQWRDEFARLRAELFDEHCKSIEFELDALERINNGPQVASLEGLLRLGNGFRISDLWHYSAAVRAKIPSILDKEGAWFNTVGVIGIPPVPQAVALAFHGQHSLITHVMNAGEAIELDLKETRYNLNAFVQPSPTFKP